MSWPARALLDRGITGKLTMLDGKTGRPRTVIDIEKAAKITAEEGPYSPRFVKYRDQTVGKGPYAGERPVVAEKLARLRFGPP